MLYLRKVIDAKREANEKKNSNTKPVLYVIFKPRLDFVRTVMMTENATTTNCKVYAIPFGSLTISVKRYDVIRWNEPSNRF